MRIVGRVSQGGRIVALLDDMIISDLVDMMLDTDVAKET